MRLSRTELRVLEQIAKGNKRTKEIAAALKKSNVQIYRAGRRLTEKGFILHFKGRYEPERISHVAMLLQLLSQYRSLIAPLANSGIELFTLLLEPKNILEIINETGLKRTMVFRKLKEAKNISFVIKQNEHYVINEKIWPKAKEFLTELKKYEETIDRRVPANAIVYFKNENEIVFSVQEAMDAVLTGFSAYGKYGIKILSPMRDYCLPKRKLTVKEVFRHSLYIAEKDKSTRNLTYVALFYLKFRKRLQGIKHNIIDNIDAVLKGQRIPEYPTLAEIKDRAELYDIRL